MIRLVGKRLDVIQDVNGFGNGESSAHLTEHIVLRETVAEGSATCDLSWQRNAGSERFVCARGADPYPVYGVAP